MLHALLLNLLGSQTALAQLTILQQTGADFPDISIIPSPVHLTHLSPLIEYNNVSNAPWYFDRAGATVEPPEGLRGTGGPRATFEYIGRYMEVQGAASGARYEFTPGLEQLGSGGSEGISTGEQQEDGDVRSFFRVQGDDSSLAWREAVVLPETEEGRVADVRGVRFDMPMPIDYPPEEFNQDAIQYTVVSAVDPQALESNITFPDNNQAAWNITSIPTSPSDPDPFLPNSIIHEHSSASPSNARNTFNTSSVLSTSTRNAILRFAVPQNTTLVKLYGSVGPDIASYSIRSITRDPFRPLNRSYSTQAYNATRPVYATGQLLYVTLLDETPEWEMEVTMRLSNEEAESGVEKRLEINGATFTTFLREQTGLGNNVGGSWLDYQNRMLAERLGWVESGGGLSGGQIAGIVVGSVAGAIILGALIFWLVRRNKRSKASTDFGTSDARRGSEATWVENSATRKTSPPV